MDKIAKKIPAVIKHIPFHLMKPIAPKELLICLCNKCRNAPVVNSILHEQDYNNRINKRRKSF